eukprot:scaffold1243_cov173-Ochromonas_danica.AAC.18
MVIRHLESGTEVQENRATRQTSVALPLVPRAENFSSVEDGAFVFLALGVQANQMNCPAAIESLVRIGGWDGDVYMISDRKNCFNEKEIVQNAGMKADKLHMVYTDEDFGNIGIDLWNSKIGTRKNRIRSFTMKTRIFDFIPDKKIQRIAYVDCDVLFGISGCAKDFITSGSVFEDHAIKFTRVDKDKSNPNDHVVTNVHAGTFVAHREASKDIMQAWKTALESNQFEHDRDAFMEAYRLGRASNGTVEAKKYTPYYALHTVGEGQKKFEAFVQEKQPSELFCINHISKTRCQELGREKVQTFVDRFQTKTYGSRYLYCPDPRLQPLLYGWFPVSYLPFCPKVEAIL